MALKYNLPCNPNKNIVPQEAINTLLFALNDDSYTYIIEPYQMRIFIAIGSQLLEFVLFGSMTDETLTEFKGVIARYDKRQNNN